MYKEFCVMVLTYGSLLSCFWCPAVSALIRTHVEKPVLSMCANTLTPPSCCGVYTPRRFRVRDGTIYICFYYPVLFMARHKTVRSLLVYCLALSTV